jgi:hypothetical protein
MTGGSPLSLAENTADLTASELIEYFINLDGTLAERRKSKLSRPPDEKAKDMVITS